MVNIYNGKLPRHKKEWNNAICSNIDETRYYHTKWSKSEKETNIVLYHLYVESKIWHKWIYLWNITRITDIENRLVVAMGEEVGGRDEVRGWG